MLASACATGGALDASDPPAGDESPVPGTIGVAVAPSIGADARAVVVAAVREDSAAARAHVAPGDRLVRLDGEPVESVRGFERRVLNTAPGRSVRVEFVHDGKARRVELPVEEIALDERG